MPKVLTNHHQRVAINSAFKSHARTQPEAGAAYHQVLLSPVLKVDTALSFEPITDPLNRDSTNDNQKLALPYEHH
jgi:hypothetical protein